MPKSITEMPAASTPLGADDILYLIQGLGLDRDKKITLEDLLANLPSPIAGGTLSGATTLASGAYFKNENTQFLDIAGSGFIPYHPIVVTWVHPTTTMNIASIAGLDGQWGRILNAKGSSIPLTSGSPGSPTLSGKTVIPNGEMVTMVYRESNNTWYCA